jgi:hypothetical protein
MRFRWTFWGALACWAAGAVSAGDLLVPDEEPSPLAGSGWWDDPRVHDFLELANPFACPDLPREPRYVDPFGWQFVQDPYRLGFVKHDEIDVATRAAAQGSADGSMQVTEFYSWLRHSTLIRPDVLMNVTGIFDGYYWAGPSQPQLPGQVDRLSLDLEAVFLGEGPVNTIIGFHPQMVADFEQPLTPRAFSFDGRIVNTYRVDRQWMLVYGLAVWDRVDLLFIPEVGVIWTPDDRWELRLLFPRSQLSYRLGEVAGGQLWLTSSLEFVAQAYQVDIPNTGATDRIQLRDWRATAGLRQDFYRISWTADVGIVFDRSATFRGPTPPFDLAPSALFRVGLWF